MDERAALIMGVVGLVGFIVGLGVWAQAQRRKMAAAWTDLAQAHGLVHKEGVNHVMGEIDMGRKIFMFQDVARDAFGQEHFRSRRLPLAFAVRVELNTQAPRTLLVQKRGLLMSKSKIEFGDAAFDDKVSVTCEDLNAARQWLDSPTRREAVRVAVLDHKAAIMGPNPEGVTHDGFPIKRAILFRRWDSGYRPKLSWLEERFQEFSELARLIDQA